MPSGAASLEVRTPHAHELDAFVDCVDAAFGTRLSPRSRERFFEWLDVERALACFDGGELVAALCAARRGQSLPGGVPGEVTALSNVAVLPTHRGRGLLKSLVVAALDAARERGESLAVLHASDAALYGRFGFAPATWSARFEIETDNGSLVEDVAEQTKGALRLLRGDEARAALPAIFDAGFSLRPGELSRSAAFWEEFFDDGEAPAASERFYAAYEESGDLDGFVVYEVAPPPESGQRRQITVVDLYALTPAATRALWRLVLGLDRFARVRTLERPLDDPLRHLLADPRALRLLEVRDGVWLRLVDVPAALSARRLTGSGTLVLEVRDGGCPWNAGRYRIESDPDGLVNVARSEAPADLALAVDTLAACYFGGSSFAALSAAGRIVEHRGGALGRADALFAVSVAPFAGDRA